MTVAKVEFDNILLYSLLSFLYVYMNDRTSLIDCLFAEGSEGSEGA